MTPTLAGIHILVVEDHADTRDLLEQALGLARARVSGAAGAREALALVSGADVIITDLGLPDEDGVWLWEQVQRQVRPIPVIVLSGYSDEQVPRMRQAGFARTLLKPIDPAEVARVVAEVVRRARRAEAPTPRRAA